MEQAFKAPEKSARSKRSRPPRRVQGDAFQQQWSWLPSWLPNRSIFREGAVRVDFVRLVTGLALPFPLVASAQQLIDLGATGLS